MSDPTIQTFCCHHRTQLDGAIPLMGEFSTNSYLFVCMVSSFLGIMGAHYQIFVRGKRGSASNSRRLTDSGNSVNSNGHRVILWLAIADFCASLGVFVRSAMWRYFQPMMLKDDEASVIFCAVTSAWTQYFYTCTWLWTLSYAINVRSYLRGEDFSMRRYHAIVWTFGALLTSVGLTVLYYPNADCQNVRELWTALARVLPNYCATYLPILIVMIGNPIIYMDCSKMISEMFMTRYTRVTSHEREVMSRFKWKFGLINIVFYICWLPNLVGGFILWTVWGSVPENIMVFIWYTMAATNPLQAFLNAFVYRRWAKTPSEPDPDPPTETHQESSPLLEKSRTWLARAQPASSSKLENPSSHRKANNCSCF
ncbi:G-protein coupled receptor 143-like [Phlebotomus papatasi]|uniref:G-protein coupled receptor 143-like n=1 Tax=Phlebotomus papatasi TaxID=29031 RepID=UPI0024835211|nr:G-protein coupled receptor 143-like [Phlebotomus papatasi]